MLNRLAQWMVLSFIFLVSTEALSERIWFRFTHTQTSSPSSVMLKIEVSKKGGAHHAVSNLLGSGNISTDYVEGNFFKPNPSGVYEVKVQCIKYTYSPHWDGFFLDGIKSEAIRITPVYTNSKPIFIEAYCPDIVRGGELASPENIHIDVSR